MSVKILTVAIVLAGTAGAAVSYFQHNPVSMAEVWREATAMRGPLASAQSQSATSAYVPSKYYRLCRSKFASVMRSRSLSDQQSACKCFDSEFQTWSPAMRDAAQITIYGTAALTMDPDRRDVEYQISLRKKNSLSNHEHQIIVSQARDQAGQFYNSMQKSFGPKSIDKAFANPLTTLVANQRVSALVDRCGIVDVRGAMRNAPAAYDKIGTRTR